RRDLQHRERAQVPRGLAGRAGAPRPRRGGAAAGMRRGPSRPARRRRGAWILALALASSVLLALGSRLAPARAEARHRPRDLAAESRSAAEPGRGRVLLVHL